MSHGQLVLSLPLGHSSGQTGLMLLNTGLTLTPAHRASDGHCPPALSTPLHPPTRGFTLAQNGRARPHGLPLTRVLPERRGAADLSKADTLTRPCFTGRWVHKKVRALRSVSLLALPVSCAVRAGDVLQRPGPPSHPRSLHPSGELALGMLVQAAVFCGRAEWTWGWQQT